MAVISYGPPTETEIAKVTSDNSLVRCLVRKNAGAGHHRCQSSKTDSLSRYLILVGSRENSRLYKNALNGIFGKDVHRGLQTPMLVEHLRDAAINLSEKGRGKNRSEFRCGIPVNYECVRTRRLCQPPG